MILRTTEAEVAGPHHLRPEFNAGTRKTMDAAPLRDPAVFLG